MLFSFLFRHFSCFPKFLLYKKLCTDMQGFLLILQSCNHVIIEHWVKSLAELPNVLKKKKAFYQNNAELLNIKSCTLIS